MRVYLLVYTSIYLYILLFTFEGLFTVFTVFNVFIVITQRITPRRTRREDIF